MQETKTSFKSRSCNQEWKLKGKYEENGIKIEYLITVQGDYKNLFLIKGKQIKVNGRINYWGITVKRKSDKIPWELKKSFENVMVYIKSSGIGLEGDMRLGSGEYSIGQIVELGNLEVTTRGVLRGNIVGSTVGVSLSKKHLQEIGIYPGQYIGRTIKVKLVRWDENAKKFNAEWIN